MNRSPRHVVIIGNGITGVSTALRLRERLPDCRITMISGESTYPWSRPALMYVFMGHMRYQDTKPWPDDLWPKQRIELVRDWVTGIDTGAKRIERHRGEPLSYDRLLIALGSRPNRFGWPGQDLDGVQGLYDLMDLRQLLDTVKRTRHAVVVGGGLIGIELAEMLHSQRVPTTLLVREDSYWNNVLPPEESALVTRAIRAAGFDLRLGSELESIEDDGRGRAAAAVTKGGERIACQLVGLTAGVSPNVDLARDAGIPCGRGVHVDDALRTRTDDVWAAGDCAEIVKAGEERGQLQQVWYTGKAQGVAAAESIAGTGTRYEPGIWFNSAKFLDLEYQTYGRVGFRVPGEQSLYWEHAGGERSFRVVHVDGTVIGINLMGQRGRHRVCERWIAEERDVDYVLAHLEQMEFDPEFAPRFEDHVRETIAAERAGATS
jgi:NADPH-dependent 2,4-dienoyl-CoA reductase/sulfur reductase-like enzyme